MPMIVTILTRLKMARWLRRLRRSNMPRWSRRMTTRRKTMRRRSKMS